MKSAFYRADVYHHRKGPSPHDFHYRVEYQYIDLDELLGASGHGPQLLRQRLAPLWFRRADYFGPSGTPLKTAVLDRVEAELGRRPSGAVRLLSQVRKWGFVFNPVSFYYCFDEDGQLAAILAEITNTPWGERHAYVMDASTHESLRWRFDKAFHVSPFFGMDHTYDWSLPEPGAQLAIHMRNLQAGEQVFAAGMTAERHEWSRANAWRSLLLRPFGTLHVPLAIYWQAALLWFKRTPFFVHPAKQTPQAESTAR